MLKLEQHKEGFSRKGSLNFSKWSIERNVIENNYNVKNLGTNATHITFSL
jgi:hypothetical protein